MINVPPLTARRLLLSMTVSQIAVWLATDSRTAYEFSSVAAHLACGGWAALAGQVGAITQPARLLAGAIGVGLASNALGYAVGHHAADLVMPQAVGAGMLAAGVAYGLPTIGMIHTLADKVGDVFPSLKAHMKKAGFAAGTEWLMVATESDRLALHRASGSKTGPSGYIAAVVSVQVDHGFRVRKSLAGGRITYVKTAKELERITAGKRLLLADFDAFIHLGDIRFSEAKLVGLSMIHLDTKAMTAALTNQGEAASMIGTFSAGLGQPQEGTFVGNATSKGYIRRGAQAFGLDYLLKLMLLDMQDHEDATKLDADLQMATSLSQVQDIALQEADKQAATDVFQEALAELEGLVGLAAVKEWVHGLMLRVKNSSRRRALGIEDAPITLHAVFEGRPGTGKTTVARIVGRALKGLGILPSGQFIEVKREDLVGQWVGHTEKHMKDKIAEAMGGILFIDEIYSLAEGGENDFGKKAIDVLLTALEEHRDKLVVIIAGYSSKMQKFFGTNDGLASRFPRQNRILFEDYGPDELYEIFVGRVRGAKYKLTKQSAAATKRILTEWYVHRDDKWANGREVRNLWEACQTAMDKRVGEMPDPNKDDLITIKEADILTAAGQGKAKPAADGSSPSGGPLAQLDAMIGLSEVKTQIRSFAALARTTAEKQKLGMSVSPLAMGLQFVGNPGTGKTESARLVGQILYGCGILTKGHVVEVKGRQLAEMDQAKIVEKFAEAEGGVLFIDEAQNICMGPYDKQGLAAIKVLVPEVENRRGRLCVIVAGYANEIEDRFIGADSGLASRFARKISFEDYSPAELAQIFELMAKKEGLGLSAECRQAVIAVATSMWENRVVTFGNARDMRNLMELAVEAQANRLAGAPVTKGDLTTLIAEDVLVADRAIRGPLAIAALEGISGDNRTPAA